MSKHITQTIHALQEAANNAHPEAAALTAIIAERLRQNAKWGEQNHDPFTYLAILMEEVGEMAKEAIELRFNDDPESAERLKTEAVQVAAVALAIVECLEREYWQWPHEEV